ncbi:MAG: sterol desaturase family protein [Verrucomicrobiae bacterium]|nr:sterol desaturase family protein [Verrucomicrobiae bacterium]
MDRLLNPQNWMELGLATGGAFLLLFLAFVPLEKLFPARANHRILRKEFWTDVGFFLGQYFLWNALILLALTWLALAVRWSVPDSLRETVVGQPYWLQFVEMLFLSDLCVYWGHRAQHRFDCLWRFHSVHHTAETVDWLAAHREHPLDGLYTQVIANLPALLLAFPLETIAGFLAFRGLWSIFIHSDVRIPLGPLKYLIGSPAMHHWHHEKHRHHACNFANVSPLMDILFGTHYLPNDKHPEKYGIIEPVPRSYLGQMFYPFLRGFSRRTSRPSMDIHPQMNAD